MPGTHLRVLVGLASAVVVLAGMRATSALLIPLVAAAFVALITFPVVQWLRRHGVHTLLAVVGTMLIVLAALVGPGVLMVAAIREFVAAAPGYEARLRSVTRGLMSWFEGHGVNITEFAWGFDPSRAIDFTVGALTGIATLFSVTAVVVLIASFMLLEGTHWAEHPGGAVSGRVGTQLGRIAREMQRYLWVKTGVSAATGLSAGVWVAVLGVDFALLWGLTAFLLNYIPNLGSLLAAIPPALLALVQIGPLGAVLVLVGYLAINTLFGNVVEPLLMGRRLGLSPLVVLVSVLTWGWMWGVTGMLLSVPIMMGVKIGCESSEELRWVAQLLGGSSSVEEVPPVVTTPPVRFPSPGE
jgi:AI-2 transport protein TqsA